MTSALFIAASLLIWANLAFVACSGPASPDPIPRYDAETFYETTAITGASFSHDEERILISTDASGVFNAYSQPFEGGPPVQLTESEDDSIFAISWFPEDDRFLYTADQGGMRPCPLCALARSSSDRTTVSPDSRAHNNVRSQRP